MTHTEELLELVHEPVAPPRPGTPGEGIYLGLWREYLAVRPERLDEILRDVHGPTTQRDATVCASFMVFMGCNGGRSLYRHAEELMSSSKMRAHDAFMAAWALANERCRSINHGLRTIEYMLAAKHPIRTDLGYVGRVDWSLVPEVTMRDIDVVEAMVDWWSTREGDEMRSIAEPMIEAANRKLLSDLYKRDYSA